MTGKKVTVNSKTATFLERDAFCFYSPMPQKKLSIPDLLIYMKNCLSASDVVRVILATIAVTLAGMLIPRITKTLTGPIIQHGEISALVGVSVCIVYASFRTQYKH